MTAPQPRQPWFHPTAGLLLCALGVALFLVAAFASSTAWQGVVLVPLGLACFAASTRVP
jgi:hypothetical protein